jgi:hypothetical protein
MPITLQPSANAMTSSSRRTGADPVSGLAVAEAHQVTAAARAQHRCRAGEVPGALLGVEDVERPAVDDRVERPAELPQAQHVGDLQPGAHPGFGGFAAGTS